ncbi:MAG: hypothetical protein K2K57_03455 [Oscillospiraceae bacterium]|nr:hypothetical protein [Oscillospiraceae bacterium]
MKQVSFSDIKSVDERGIIFKDGSGILFSECAGRHYKSGLCIAERDITAKPPYFEFFASAEPVRILFDKKNFISRNLSRRQFTEFQMMIQNYGYTTYDLS